MTTSQRRAIVRMTEAIRDHDLTRLHRIRRAVERGQVQVAYYLVCTAMRDVRGRVPVRVRIWLARRVEGFAA